MLKCPECKIVDGLFKIYADMPVQACVDAKEEVIDSEYGGDSSIYYDGESACACTQCNYTGIVDDFR